VTSQTFSSSKVVEPAPALILNSINIETVRKAKAVRMKIGWRLYKRGSMQVCHGRMLLVLQRFKLWNRIGIDPGHLTPESTKFLF
jgi:hypothetical protein